MVKNGVPHLVEIKNMSFCRGLKTIYNDVNLSVPQGKITAIMGPSGIGKTTLLHLIGGQLKPKKGEILFADKNISRLPRADLYQVRKQMGMLFQSAALFTDLTVFENVAFPLRQHYQLPMPVLHDLVLMKLEAVGLRGTAKMMPAELSSGMARRVALARAMVLDPKLMMFDEPFAGQDPIAMAVLVELIAKLNHSLGLTCIIVSHDVKEVLSIADYAYIIAEQKIIAGGTPTQLVVNNDERVKQFLDGIADGPVPFHYAAPDYCLDLLNYH